MKNSDLYIIEKKKEYISNLLLEAMDNGSKTFLLLEYVIKKSLEDVYWMGVRHGEE